MSLHTDRIGQLWISTILYFLVASIVVTIVLSAALPYLRDMKDAALFEGSKGQLKSIDAAIMDVASDGIGSRRVVPVTVRKGELYMDSAQLGMVMQTNKEIVSHRSQVHKDGYTLFADLDVKAVSMPTYLLLQNSFISINMTRIDTPTYGNTSELINSITWIPSQTILQGDLNFVIDNDNGSVLGLITTSLLHSGVYMGSSSLVIWVQNASVHDQLINYNISLTLESQADYIKPSFHIDKDITG